MLNDTGSVILDCVGSACATPSTCFTKQSPEQAAFDSSSRRQVPESLDKRMYLVVRWPSYQSAHSSVFSQARQ